MIAAIVLAAGSSKRMGRPKQTLKVKGKPMLQKVVDTFKDSRVDKIVVVVGAHEKEVREKVDLSGQTVLVNPHHKDGMSGSLKMGLAEVRAEAEAVIVALGDKPLLSADTINRIIDSYLRTRAPMVVPVYRGTQGNPVLFDRRMFDDIMTVSGDVGAKSVIQRNKGLILEVPVDDEGVMVDIDTPADYQKLKRSAADR